MPWKYRKQLNDFMTAVSDDSEGEIWIYGDIVDDAWWDNEVSPITIRDSLDEMGPVANLNIRVNSYGGSVYAGNAIINILNSYRNKTGATITAYIEGIAASMGSGIPMVADKIYMAENAMYMLHKPYTVVVGNSVDLEKEIEVLEKAEETLISNYMIHFNGSKDELKDLLKNETWMTAEEALEYGLCDEIIQAVPIAASAKGSIIINGESYTENSIVAKFRRGIPLAALEKPVQESEGNKMFVYDEKLKDYGIDSETFKNMNMSAEIVLSILDSAVIRNETSKVYMTSEDVKNALGEEMEAETVLSFAKAGMEIDDQLNAKAKAYDKLVNNTIEDALKSGIRAKGENFNDTKWKKILSSLDYEEILDQAHEWDEEAKFALNAGKHISEMWKQEQNPENSAVNINDYKF